MLGFSLPLVSFLCSKAAPRKILCFGMMVGIECKDFHKLRKCFMPELHLQPTAAPLEVDLSPRAVWDDDSEEGSWGIFIGHTCAIKCDRAVRVQRSLAESWVGGGSQDFGE